MQNTFIPADERNKRQKWKRLRRLYNKFTAKLRIPCYKNLSYFYYYDVLEGLARVLFQYDLEVTSLMEEREQKSQDGDSLSISDVNSDDPLKTNEDASD